MLRSKGTLLANALFETCTTVCSWPRDRGKRVRKTDDIHTARVMPWLRLRRVCSWSLFGGYRTGRAVFVDGDQNEFGGGDPHPLALAAAQNPGLDADRHGRAADAGDLGIDADDVAH